MDNGKSKKQGKQDSKKQIDFPTERDKICKELDYESVISIALEEAYERINRKAVKKSKLSSFKTNSIGCSKEVISKHFVFSCPLTKSYSMPDVKKVLMDDNGRVLVVDDDKKVLVEDTIKAQEDAATNEKYRMRRRLGISERNANDRDIFRYALKNYATVENAINYDLM